MDFSVILGRSEVTTPESILDALRLPEWRKARNDTYNYDKMEDTQGLPDRLMAVPKPINFRDRLMVGPQTLNLRIYVRVVVSEQGLGQAK